MHPTETPARPQRTLGLSRDTLGRPVPSLRLRSVAAIADLDVLRGWAWTLAVTALALFLRLWELGSRNKFQFDETYYAKDAWSMLQLGYASNWTENANDTITGGGLHAGLMTGTPEIIAHPEVGKWMIALGEWVFGMTPFGWRVSAAVVGSLMVMVMVRLCRRITGSTLLGVIGGLLMCFDGLHFLLSRMALLDIFQAAFMLFAVSCMVADRDYGRAKLAKLVPRRLDDPRAWGPMLWWRPWRVMAGVWLGLSVGTKWGTLYVLAALGLLAWAWDSGARRRLGVAWSVPKAAILDAAPAVIWLVLLPLVVYVASWTGWLLHANLYETAYSNGQFGSVWGSYLDRDAQGFLPELTQSLRSLWHYHQDMWGFHTGSGLANSTHDYQSNPGGWLVLNRPVTVDTQLGIQPGVSGCLAPADSTCLRHTTLLGNPAVWWGGTLALIVSLFVWIGRRDWRFGLVVVGVAVTWLPWFRFDDRPIFSFYAIQIEPFLILGLVLVLGMILGPDASSRRRRRVGVAVVASFLVLVIATFAWFWPVLTFQLITTPDWLQRMWFQKWV